MLLAQAESLVLEQVLVPGWVPELVLELQQELEVLPEAEQLPAPLLPVELPELQLVVQLPAV